MPIAETSADVPALAGAITALCGTVAVLVKYMTGRLSQAIRDLGDRLEPVTTKLDALIDEQQHVTSLLRQHAERIDRIEEEHAAAANNGRRPSR